MSRNVLGHDRFFRRHDIGGLWFDKTVEERAAYLADKVGCSDCGAKPQQEPYGGLIRVIVDHEDGCEYYIWAAAQ